MSGAHTELKVLSEGDGGKKQRKGFWDHVVSLVGIRGWLFGYDYFAMRFARGRRYQQLASETLTCRFCSTPIDLMGSWVCSCGFKRPGNYFGRCPNCLTHPEYIDCPACTYTMDVR